MNDRAITCNEQEARALLNAAAAENEKVSARNNEEPRGLTGSFGTIPLKLISPSVDNPRKHFDEIAMSELVGSIKAHGLLEPIVIRHIPLAKWADTGGPEYEIICGERRWRAAKQASLETIPCRILDDIDDRKALELALVENLCRKDIDPIEEAEGYRKLQEMGYKQSDIAERVHRSQEAVSNAIRLLKLPESVQELVSGGKITVSHAKALLPHVERPKVLEALCEKAADGATVKEIERPSYVMMEKMVKQGAARFLASWKRDFNTDECLKCEHLIACTSSYNWCLNPSCWDEKQKAALEAERQRNEDIAKDCEILNLYDLNPNTWASLNIISRTGELLGCPADCEHRKEGIWSGISGKIPVCLNPECNEKRWIDLVARQKEESERQKAERLELLESIINADSAAELLPALCLQVLYCLDTAQIKSAAKRFKMKLDSDAIGACYPGKSEYDDVHLLQISKMGVDTAIKMTAYALFLYHMQRGYPAKEMDWIKGRIEAADAAPTESIEPQEPAAPAERFKCKQCGGDVYHMDIMPNGFCSEDCEAVWLGRLRQRILHEIQFIDEVNVNLCLCCGKAAIDWWCNCICCECVMSAWPNESKIPEQVRMVQAKPKIAVIYREYKDYEGDAVRLYLVSKGLGRAVDSKWMVFRRMLSGTSLRRIGSIPAQETPELAQAELDAFAAKKGLKEHRVVSKEELLAAQLPPVPSCDTCCADLDNCRLPKDGRPCPHYVAMKEAV